MKNEEKLLHLLERGETVLLCGWHQQFFAAIGTFNRYNRFSPAVMVSQSNDGEFISRIAHRVGWKTVRGSSSRGGRSAMYAMIDHLKKHQMAAHILDGPQGPIGTVKPGAIKMAHESGSLIVPLYVVADNAWYFKSWDQFMLPKPFTRVEIVYGQEIKYKKTENSEEFEKQVKHLQDSLIDHAVIKYPIRQPKIRKKRG